MMLVKHFLYCPDTKMKKNVSQPIRTKMSWAEAGLTRVIVQGTQLIVLNWETSVQIHDKVKNSPPYGSTASTIDERVGFVRSFVRSYFTRLAQ